MSIALYEFSECPIESISALQMVYVFQWGTLDRIAMYINKKAETKNKCRIFEALKSSLTKETDIIYLAASVL